LETAFLLIFGIFLAKLKVPSNSPVWPARTLPMEIQYLFLGDLPVKEKSVKGEIPEMCRFYGFPLKNLWELKPASAAKTPYCKKLRGKPTTWQRGS
jgi:hypothetical protein